MDSVKNIELQYLANIHKDAVEAQKHVIIWDQTGQADTFFNYNSNLADFNRDVKKVEGGFMEASEALEKLRVKMVPSMRTGKIFAIHVANVVPDFHTMFAGTEDIFPSAQVFNWEAWRVHETYMKTVRDDENHNDMGNKGAFYQDSKFCIVISATYESQEKCQELLDKIPHSDQMMKFMIM